MALRESAKAARQDFECTILVPGESNVNTKRANNQERIKFIP